MRLIRASRTMAPSNDTRMLGIDSALAELIGAIPKIGDSSQPASSAPTMPTTIFKIRPWLLSVFITRLASQPTMSRWENNPTTRELVRLTGTLVDIYCESYCAPSAAVTLDIDDTVDVVRGA